MTEGTKGKLIGVGVGPGAPDLMTVRATRLISSADVIAYPQAEGKESRSLAIIQDWLADDTELLPITIDMTPKAGAADPAYDAVAPVMEKHSAEGRSVLVLCEGDPLLYGSFIALLARLGDKVETEVVPGITSPLAAAAQLSLPLATKSAPFRILPATMSEDNLTEELARPGTAAIIKPRRHDDKIKSALATTARLERALLVEEATHDHSRSYKLTELEGPLPYFSLILCPDINTDD